VAGKPLEILDLVQAGIRLSETMDAANTAGVVHGSLASDCVYIAAGNEVQVTGFGFARVQRGDPACVPPELSRVKGDRRSDVYGIGAILWEMATGEVAPPDPMPATQLRPDLPMLLDGIIRTALEPDPRKRHQSAAGLAQSLRHFQEGCATPRKLSRAQMAGVSGKHRRTKRVSTGIADSRWAGRVKWFRRGAAVAVVLTVAFAVYIVLMRRESFRQTGVSQLTETGDIVEAAISPDGASLALVREEPGGQSLWTRPTTGKVPVRLVPPVAAGISDIAFSRTGKEIYFLRGDTATLHFIATAGGDVTTLAKGVKAPRLSPDTLKLAFVRKVGIEHTLVIANPNGSEEVVAQARAAPAELTGAAWAPGGKMFAVGVFVPGEGHQVMTAHLDGSYTQPLGWQLWPGPIRFAWLPGADAVIVVGPERSGVGRVWRVKHPEGTTAIIAGGADYSGLSLTANGKSLVTVATIRNASLWTIPAGEPSAVRQVSRGEGPDGVRGLDWLSPTHLVYASEDKQSRGLWVIDAEGKGSGPILRHPDQPLAPHVSPDGQRITFVWIQEKARHVWTVDPDGKGLRDVTRTGLQDNPSFAPDGQSIYYNTSTNPALAVPDSAEAGIWRIPTEGGRPERVAPGPAEYAAVSPTGDKLAYRVGAEVFVVTLAQAQVEARLPISEPGQVGWTPDGKAIVWAKTRGRIANLWAHPLDGGAPVQLTAFTTPGRIHSFAWSRDGKTIALSRGDDVRHAVLIHDKSW
jgi:Tol biopolymer transport system component